jgi:hypothetical protein
MHSRKGGGVTCCWRDKKAHRDQNNNIKQGKTGAMLAYLEIAEGGVRASITPLLLYNSNAIVADALTSTCSAVVLSNHGDQAKVGIG